MGGEWLGKGRRKPIIEVVVVEEEGEEEEEEEGEYIGSSWGAFIYGYLFRSGIP